ncbi:hypothetical protein E3P92_02442 [Wallemia ichthyophaga]|uniref:RRM domain-containing protein n=2 Tax=Wallemia ichthyophaga TaxID=245174 RepID=A0A4T0H802_WALIC|nr:Protein vip1 [Wallemia ichthyophaga EXF-994]TIA71649.1 hypothetical protein E3P91_02454 [Wallemia ichthyophaga]EOQ99380.1 Protein vip1 [Wallemia ichthyophaga EXF-994]TIA81107.1 hypothetical protein E3P98_02259 [Wallemia ichthyophaga]TIA90620.1 hypothetical protein E3P97_02455 [Wallemia ichthyophaga]TIA99374.1 hypothetical protein E3P95_02097 [Wallemia ichthyophaga]
MASILVTKIATGTTDEQIVKFFSFCGKVKASSFEQDTTHRTAYIEFERESAARTALLLNGGNLEGSLIEVSSNDVDNGVAGPPPGSTANTTTHSPPPSTEHVVQEDKPRTAILAQYLAHGYHIGDEAIQKAIDLDSKHGISNRFITYLHQFDEGAGKRTGNADLPLSSQLYEKAQGLFGKAKEIDTQKGISEKSTGWFGPYYQKALNSPYAAKVQSFYTNAHKQVLDVHEEALRIAAQKKDTFVNNGGDVNATSIAKAPADTDEKKPA